MIINAKHIAARIRATSIRLQPQRLKRFRSTPIRVKEHVRHRLPGAHRLLQSFSHQLDADRRRLLEAVAARLLQSTVGEYGLIGASPQPPLHLVVATQSRAQRVRFRRSKSHDGILFVSCDKPYRATSCNDPLGNHGRQGHRSTTQMLT